MTNCEIEGRTPSFSSATLIEYGMIAAQLDVEKARLATEEEFQRMFPDCEVGAMPPFGNLYGIDVYVAPNLAAEKEIAFNAGTHTDVIKMTFEDFERLVQPRVLSFTT